MQVSLDDAAKSQPAPQLGPEGPSSGDAVSALDILLDGVESRLAKRTAS